MLPKRYARDMRRLKSFPHVWLQTENGSRLVGYVRGQPLVAGPEEIVRQNVLRTLVREYGYPRQVLRAEEPVARGTDNRDRADVIVKLPRRRDALLVRTAAPTAALTELPEYSTLRAGAVPSLPRLESVSISAIPDRLEVACGERNLECIVRGFVPSEHGIDLCLDVPPGCAELGLPEMAIVRVLGYGRTDEEDAISRALALSNVDATDPGTEEFCVAVDQALERMDLGTWVSGAQMARMRFLWGSSSPPAARRSTTRNGETVGVRRT